MEQQPHMPLQQQYVGQQQPVQAAPVKPSILNRVNEQPPQGAQGQEGIPMVAVRVPKNAAVDGEQGHRQHVPMSPQPLQMPAQQQQGGHVRRVPVMSMQVPPNPQETQQYDQRHHGRRYRSTYTPSAYSSGLSSMPSGGSSYDTSRPPGCIEWIMNSRCSHGDCMPLLTMASASSRRSRSSSSSY